MAFIFYLKILIIFIDFLMLIGQDVPIQEDLHHDIACLSDVTAFEVPKSNPLCLDPVPKLNIAQTQ